ncbi:uncharacterized protein CLUP02_06481 [Colletotrichum lupini]|uniref:Uncharacterized protein n=1 Tax=Colletotrichum lupini TaxID=145971 RepID=A0A9Q8SQ31_9PEZI|nr:uncharacterized protein CLUP02_06481 [Colletotrichum lupini]UQC80995.1 hypothetical protein CLUP02_06481 [Colletotrichum lupini]
MSSYVFFLEQCLFPSQSVSTGEDAPHLAEVAEARYRLGTGKRFLCLRFPPPLFALSHPCPDPMVSETRRSGAVPAEAPSEHAARTPGSLQKQLLSKSNLGMGEGDLTSDLYVSGEPRRSWISNSLDANVQNTSRRVIVGIQIDRRLLPNDCYLMGEDHTSVLIKTSESAGLERLRSEWATLRVLPEASSRFERPKPINNLIIPRAAPGLVHHIGLGAASLHRLGLQPNGSGYQHYVTMCCDVARIAQTGSMGTVPARQISCTGTDETECAKRGDTGDLLHPRQYSTLQGKQHVSRPRHSSQTLHAMNMQNPLECHVHIVMHPFGGRLPCCICGRPMGATFKDKVGALPNPDDEFGIESVCLN